MSKTKQERRGALRDEQLAQLRAAVEAAIRAADWDADDAQDSLRDLRDDYARIFDRK